MNKMVISLGAGSALLIALAGGWFLQTSGQPKEEDLKFLHCPQCGLEVPFTAALKGKLCFRCEAPKPALVGTAKSIAEGGSAGSSRTSLFVVLIFMVLVLAEAVVYGYVLNQRAKDSLQRKVVEKLSCRCPYCRRKFRYPASRIGEGTQCPQCKTAFAWPADSGEEVDD